MKEAMGFHGGQGYVLMPLALLSAGCADLFCRCFVINTSPSVLINGRLRYLRAVTLMTQRCTLKIRAAVRARLTAV